MKVANVGIGLALAAASTLLVGCNGQNPFQHNSDPIPQYHDLTGPSAQKWTPEMQKLPPPPPAPIVRTEDPCNDPFQVRVGGDTGNTKLLTFTEEVVTTYNIQIISNMGPDFKVELIGKPSDAHFDVGPKTTNSITYKLTWKPVKSDIEQNPIQTLGIRYTSPTSVNCKRPVKPDQLNVVLQKSEGEPLITIKFRDANVTFGGQLYTFDVYVEDPASTEALPPQLGAAEFPPRAANLAPVLDGSPAVHCAALHLVAKTNWRAKCEFDTTRIKDAQSKIESDEVVDTLFYLTAKSQGGAKRPSAATPAQIPVTFAKLKVEKPEKIVPDTSLTQPPEEFAPPPAAKEPAPAPEEPVGPPSPLAPAPARGAQLPPPPAAVPAPAQMAPASQTHVSLTVAAPDKTKLPVRQAAILPAKKTGKPTKTVAAAPKATSAPAVLAKPVAKPANPATAAAPARPGTPSTVAATDPKDAGASAAPLPTPKPKKKDLKRKKKPKQTAPDPAPAPAPAATDLGATPALDSKGDPQ